MKFPFVVIALTVLITLLIIAINVAIFAFLGWGVASLIAKPHNFNAVWMIASSLIYVLITAIRTCHIRHQANVMLEQISC